MQYLNDYFTNNIIFNINYNNDLLSPIIYYNNIIGNCYKCIPNINNYNNCHDYTELLRKDIFFKTIKLYFNYLKIFQNMKSNKPNIEQEKYFLVNKAFISQIKQALNFLDFCKFLKQGEVFNNFNLNIFNTIKLLKNSPIDILKKFFANKGINTIEQHTSLLEIGIIPIKYYDSNNEKCVMIYNDYELIDEKTIELFVNINLIQNYLIKCIINEGKIMLLYSKNFDFEKRCITVIGKIGSELKFIT